MNISTAKIIGGLFAYAIGAYFLYQSSSIDGVSYPLFLMGMFFMIVGSLVICDKPMVPDYKPMVRKNLR